MVSFVPAAAQEPSPRTPEEMEQRHRDPKAYIAMLEGPARDAYQKPDEVVRALDLKPGEGFTDAVRTVGERARELLHALPDAIGGVPKAARSPALIASLSRRYLRDLERCGWDPFVLEQRPAWPLLVAGLAVRAALHGY